MVKGYTSYFGFIGGLEGQETEVAIPGLPGWMVSKETQTGYYEIIHNLNLSNYEEMLNIAVHVTNPEAESRITEKTKDAFKIKITRKDTPDMEAVSDFTFAVTCGLD